MRRAESAPKGGRVRIGEVTPLGPEALHSRRELSWKDETQRKNALI